LSAKISIGFEWPRGRAYEIVEPSLPRSKKDPLAAMSNEPHIRQTGRTEKENPARQPLEIHPSLYLDFVKLDGAAEFAEACRHFAQNWGLLTRYAEPNAQEPLSLWRSEIKTMKDTIERLRRAFEEKIIPSRGEWIPTDLQAVLVPPGKPDGRARLLFRPRVLRDAMRIQLMQSIAVGNAVNACPVCGSWFERGGRGGDVKRSIARFCSDRCRNAFHNKQRASK
jgi:hypothetical protein